MSSEAQEVKAEVVEPAREVVKYDVGGSAIRFSPAEIEADWDGIEERLLGLMEPYKGMTAEGISGMSEAEIKACRKDVNSIIKQVEDARKAVKKAYSEPLKAFESKVKALEVPATEASDLLKAALDEKERQRKADKRRALIEHFEEVAPELVPVVSYEVIAGKASKPWENKTPSLPKCMEEEEAIIAQAMKDWDALKQQRETMAFFAEAEAEYFRTLDLGRALRLNSEREEEQARIDEANRRMDEALAYRAGTPEERAGQEPEPMPEPAPEYAPEPEPVIEPEPAQAPAMVRVRFETDPITVEAKDALFDALRALGIHGSCRVEGVR